MFRDLLTYLIDTHWSVFAYFHHWMSPSSVNIKLVDILREEERLTFPKTFATLIFFETRRFAPTLTNWKDEDLDEDLEIQKIRKPLFRRESLRRSLVYKIQHQYFEWWFWFDGFCCSFQHFQDLRSLPEDQIIRLMIGRWGWGKLTGLTTDDLLPGVRTRIIEFCPLFNDLTVVNWEILPEPETKRKMKMRRWRSEDED